MKNRRDLYFKLLRGNIFNNLYISDKLELEYIFESIKLEIDETPLNSIYLNKIGKKVYKVKNALILVNTDVATESLKISTRKDKEYLSLLITINKLDDISNIVNLSLEKTLTQEEKDFILSFKNEGLIIHKEKDFENYILFSDILLKDYEENYKYIIDRKKRLLHA